MSFAGEDQLDRASGIGQKADKSLGIARYEIGTLLGCEPPSESDGEHVHVKRAAWIGGPRPSAASCDASRLTHTTDQHLAARRAQLPQFGVGELTDVASVERSSRKSGRSCGPEPIRLNRVPGGHVDSIGN